MRTSLESDEDFGDQELEEPLPEKLDDEASTIDSDSSVSIQMYSIGYTEPSKTLDTLLELGTQISVVGRELLRNRPVTHYRARLDQREAVRHELKESGWKDENIVCAVADMSETTDLVEVWIGDDGLVHRTITTSTWDPGIRDVGEPPMVETTVGTTDYFDFGAALTIEPPPADQVVDEDDLRDAYRKP